MKRKTFSFPFSEMISIFFAILPTEKKSEPEINGSKLPWYFLGMHFRMFPAQVF